MLRLFRKALIVILPLFAAGCGGGDSTSPMQDSDPVVVEIFEYMGEKLTSVSTLRDNSLKGPQVVDIDSWRLLVDGLVDNPRVFTYEELLARDTIKRLVWLHCVDGWSAKILWEGISLKQLFEEVGVKSNAHHAIFYAVDGYHNFLSVNYIQVNDIIAATHANGKPLAARRGFPLHVISQSKYGYKWCKWVTRIELVEDGSQAGYYENGGYSREGNVGDHYYDPDESRLRP
jgi:DMSO/TMAO reductase YedYZ molybdopterin-dependent catalytic subunit